jgi:hypothetical protein
MGKEVKQKRPVGRPSKYKPEYCEAVIEMAKQGKGWASYAATFEIDRATLYDWAAAHEEFSTALTRAKVLEQQWWEDQARENLRSREFNANLWIKSAQARFREDYTERKETAVTGANGGPVQVQSHVLDAKTLTPEQRNALREILMAAKEAK